MHVLIPLPAESWEAFRSLDVVLGEPLIVKLFLVRQGRVSILLDSKKKMNHGLKDHLNLKNTLYYIRMDFCPTHKQT